MNQRGEPTIKQTMLPFKLEVTKDLITPHAGLALLGEFAVGLGILKALDKNLPAPGNGAGYRASEHVLPLLMMLNGGGRSLEDLRQIKSLGDSDWKVYQNGFIAETVHCMNKTRKAFRLVVIRRPIHGGLFVLKTLDESWHRHQVQTLRWKLYEAAGKIIFHRRDVWLKVRRHLRDLFSKIRLRTWEFANH